MSELVITTRLSQVVRLVGGEGMTYREVAEELELSYRTVVSHAVRARDRSGLDLSPKAALARLYRDDPEKWEG